MVGGAISYSPFEQVLMSWHTRSDVVDAAVKMNWWLSQAVCASQPRSLVAVGTFVSYSERVHFVTATHALPLLAVEYVVPTVHAVHWRSAVAEPATD